MSGKIRFVATRGVVTAQLSLPPDSALQRIPHGFYALRTDWQSVSRVEASEMFVTAGGVPRRKLLLTVDLLIGAEIMRFVECGAAKRGFDALLTDSRTGSTYSFRVITCTAWTSFYGRFIAPPPSGVFRCTIRTDAGILLEADAFVPEVRGGEPRVDVTIDSETIDVVARALLRAGRVSIVGS